jgi:hypothetical protein
MPSQPNRLPIADAIRAGDNLPAEAGIHLALLLPCKNAFGAK